MKTKKFNWKNWSNSEHRLPTHKEAVMLVKMFEECHWCVIRDILIDSGLTDESFPNFWYDVMDKKLKTSKGNL